MTEERHKLQSTCRGCARQLSGPASATVTVREDLQKAQGPRPPAAWLGPWQSRFAAAERSCPSTPQPKAATHLDSCQLRARNACRRSHLRRAGAARDQSVPARDMFTGEGGGQKLWEGQGAWFLSHFLVTLLKFCIM